MWQVAFFQVEDNLLVLELLKMLLLLDVLLYARCRVVVQQQAPAIRTVFEAVGYRWVSQKEPRRGERRGPS